MENWVQSLSAFLAHGAEGSKVSLKYRQASVVVHLSTFSNDISSEAMKPVLTIFHI